MLPDDLHLAAIDELRLQALGVVCPCAGTKRAHVSFCERCQELIERAGFGYELGTVQHFAENKIVFGIRTWRRYDCMIDAAVALRTGRWDGKRVKRKDCE